MIKIYKQLPSILLKITVKTLLANTMNKLQRINLVLIKIHRVQRKLRTVRLIKPSLNSNSFKTVRVT